MYAFLDQEYFGLKAWVVILGCTKTIRFFVLDFYRVLADEGKVFLL